MTALKQALDDAEPLMRDHAAWALDRLAERDGARRCAVGGDQEPPLPDYPP